MEPVSTPCGHSFCKACLQGYWNHSKKFTCPMCKKSYSKKPEMSVNRVLAEISTQFQGLVVAGGAEAASRGSTLNLSSDTAHVGPPGPDTGEFARPGEVPCDACIGRKLKALKSCVNCPGSFCDTHLRHHKKVRSSSSLHLSQSVVVLLLLPLFVPLCYYFIISYIGRFFYFNHCFIYVLEPQSC